MSNEYTQRGRGMAAESLAIIEAARDILDEIAPATVRAICYRLFIDKLIPDMSKGSTNKVSRLLTVARERGDIEWDQIVDETRSVERVSTWNNPDEIIEASVLGYRKDYWAAQPTRIEVWSEKGTVRGTLSPVLDKYGVPFRVMHGYGSATTLNDIAEASNDDPRPFVALYVGDYDPSGMHMSEVDLPERIDRYGGCVSVRRIALREEDTEDLPFFPLADKMNDPRAVWYAENYGRRCWELDAMSPPDLRSRAEVAIVGRLDAEAWEHSIAIEQAEKDSMQQFFTQWQKAKGQR